MSETTIFHPEDCSDPIDITGITQFGVAILDDPDMAGEDSSGWASVAGDKPFRFARLSDLESDTIWVNNASYEAARLAKHYSVHNLRGDYFLGTKLSSILDDVTAGARPPNNLVAQQLSVIADRACRFAVKGYGEAVLGGYSLAAGILNCAKETKVPSTGEPWLDYALIHAYQKGASCDTRAQTYLKNAKTVTIRYNRLIHAASVMELLIPDGGFEYVKSSPKMTVDAVLSQNRPVLAQVSISKIAPEVASILGFGSYVGGRQGRTLREWVSGPELAMLSEFASIKVKGAVFWESAVPLQKRFQLAPSFDDPLLVLSYSASLVAESHLSSLLLGKRNEQTKAMQYSPRAVFVAAMDRVTTFPLARALRNEGYTVMYYGGGCVQIRAQTSMLKDLSSFVRDAGAAFPLPEISERRISE